MASQAGGIGVTLGKGINWIRYVPSTKQTAGAAGHHAVSMLFLKRPLQAQMLDRYAEVQASY